MNDYHTVLIQAALIVALLKLIWIDRRLKKLESQSDTEQKNT